LVVVEVKLGLCPGWTWLDLSRPELQIYVPLKLSLSSGSQFLKYELLAYSVAPAASKLPGGVASLVGFDSVVKGALWWEKVGPI